MDFEKGESRSLPSAVKRIRVCDVSRYLNFVQMDIATFEEILARVAPRITYQDTQMKPAIPPAERLAITLRFLATGMNRCNKYKRAYITVDLRSLYRSLFKAYSTCTTWLPKHSGASFQRRARQS